MGVCCYGDGWCSECGPRGWASLPGLSYVPHGYTYCRGVSGRWGRFPLSWTIAEVSELACERVWLTSTRLPEPLSPEARALVQAARGAK